MARRGAKRTKTERRRNALARPARAELRASPSRKDAKSAKLTRELNEALAREAASAEVLRVISSSPGDLDAVFRTMLENATRLCEAKFGTLFRYDGEKMHRLAGVRTPKSLTEFQRKRGPFAPGPGTNMFKSVRSKRPLMATNEATSAKPGVAATYGGARSTLYIPLLKDGQVVGMFVIYRQEVRPFTDKQIELVKNFAAQAVIAIENTRLLNELRQRTDDLTELLEQQTAISDILSVISNSPSDVKPVFETVARHAARICEAQIVDIITAEEGKIVVAATFGELGRPIGEALPLDRTSVMGRSIVDKQAVAVADLSKAGDEFPLGQQLAFKYGHRSILAVPLLREGRALGTILVRRTEVRPFEDKHITLLKTFADQAAIAIENARLFNELRQRTDDLSESLEQQTATSEVLRVISSSPGALEPVFGAVLENAVRICEANFGNLVLYDNGVFRVPALHGANEEWAAVRRREPVVHAGPNHPFTRVIRTKRLLHIADMRQDEAYLERDPSLIPFVEKAGARTNLIVPMLKEDELVGAIAIYRHEVRPFTDKQIELVQNFAAQAVIAIENTRLLSELRRRTDDLTELLEQQTATSEILASISSSMTDAKPVFDAIVRNLLRLFGTRFASVQLLHDETIEMPAADGVSGFEKIKERYPRPLDDTTVGGQAMLSKQVMQYAPVHGNPLVPSAAQEIARDFEYNSMIAAPMIRQDRVIGSINAMHHEPRVFSEKEVALIKAFADQAVIAIENVRLFNELRQRTDDLTELLEQQTSTSEVLRVISSSPGELEPVFNAMLENATRSCAAKFGILFLCDGDGYRTGAMHNAPLALVEARRREALFRPAAHTAIGRMARTKRAVQLTDMLAEPGYFEAPPGYSKPQIANLGGARTVVSVPMLKDDELVGAIVIYRQEVRPFTEKQIELVQNFAAQAVIAIENTRLLNELRQRTSDLSEALEQQTATAEVLKVISSSPGELEPVFQAMLENATHICEAQFGCMFGYDSGAFRPMALLNVPEAHASFITQRGPFQALPGSILDRILQTNDVASFDDDAAGTSPSSASRLGGARSTIGVPMLKNNVLIGAIVIYRQEVRPFTGKQVELVRNFAAQAVIAIENTRLLNELRESLQQQTATADVLKVISRSAFELQPVFNSMAESAVRLCEAERAYIFRFDGKVLQAVASFNAGPENQDWVHRNPIPLGRHSVSARAGLERRTVQVGDIQADPEYNYVARDVDPIRTTLAVPMLKGDELIGTITIYRLEVKPFTENQIALMETFADQAVIAIENVRLFEEVQKRTAELSESLQQQTATAEVLKVISRSTFDLQTVLDTLVESAARLCSAPHGLIFRFDGTSARAAAAFNNIPGFKELWAENPILPNRRTATGRAIVERRAVHIPDVLADPEYSPPEGSLKKAQKLGQYRTTLVVPMLREGVPLGTITLWKTIVEPFNEKQIELVTTFADQAVIAIENARLFDEVQTRTEELAESLQQQTATSEVLKVISRSTFDLQTVLQTLVEAAARLCEADQGTIAREQDGIFVRAASYGFSDQFNELVKDLAGRAGSRFSDGPCSSGRAYGPHS